MDAELRREVIRRIGERKRELDDARAFRAHLEAIAEVFDLEVTDVEAIAAGVSAEQAGTSAVGGAIGAGWRYAIGAGLVAALLLGAVAALVLNQRDRLASAPQSAPAPVTALASPASTPDNRPYVQASIVADILASIAPVRMMMMEYRMSEGVFPSRLEEIGLSRADMRTGRHIDDLILGDDGAIMVKAVDALAPDAYVVMSPRETMGGLNMEWHCATTVDLGRLVPCAHQPLRGVAERF